MLPAGYTVRPFLPFDLGAFPEFMARLRLAYADPVQTFAIPAAQGPSYTTLLDGLPVACGGVVPTHRGNGTAWQVDRGDVTLHPKLHLQLARVYLDLAETAWGLWRIEATAEVTNAAAIRWLEHLGFTREGCRWSYIVPGDAHWLYARLRDGGALCS